MILDDTRRRDTKTLEGDAENQNLKHSGINGKTATLAKMRKKALDSQVFFWQFLLLQGQLKMNGTKINKRKSAFDQKCSTLHYIRRKKINPQQTFFSHHQQQNQGYQIDSPEVKESC